jgi:cellulose synthase/poly-beta-1,6-N-acetylglucosamine synthase-like glycosyltransferase
MTPEYLLTGVVLIAGLCYMILLIIFTSGWFRLPVQKASYSQLHQKVSVIVAARNEEDNILNCLNSLIKQDYPKALTEIIIVNDASDDNTVNKVVSFINEHKADNIKLIDSEKKSGKKQALYQALKISNGGVILTTDADCTHGNQWISVMQSFLNRNDTYYITGPVEFIATSQISDLVLGTEFMSLIASGAGAIGTGFPIMSNGANMGFVKQAYEQLGDDPLCSQQASGEDVFLMHAFRNKFGSRSIGFAKSREAVVYTLPPGSAKEFLSQRLRWTSKSRSYKNGFLIFTALNVLLTNTLLAVLLVLSIFLQDVRFPALLLFGMKLLADFPLLSIYSVFIKKSYRIPMIIPMEILIAFYTSITGIAGNFANSKWKGRSIRDA